MHRIDTPNATEEGRFTEGNPMIPVAPTEVSADWLNAVQGEMETVIDKAGIDLDKEDNTQLWRAIMRLAPQPDKFWLLTRLTAPLTVYVATTGNDAAADGTAGLPFRTIKAALAHVVGNYHLGTYNVTIQIAAGTYDEAVVLPTYVTNTGAITLKGAGADTIIDPGAQANTGVALSSSDAYVLDGVQIRSGASAVGEATCVRVSRGSVTLQNCVLTPAASGRNARAIFVSTGGSCSLGVNSQLAAGVSITMAGSPPADALLVSDGATLYIISNLTINGAATAICHVSSAGSVTAPYTPPPSVTGAATGMRYRAELNGTINTNGLGPNFFPGDVAGTTATGGQYA